MKILQLCIRFPPAPGGAENHVYHISKELIKRGHELKVFTSDLYTEVPFVRIKNPKVSHHGITVRRFKSFTLGDEMHYIFIPSMIRALLKEDADVFHTHSYGYFQTNAGAFAKKMRNLPLVITPHFHPQWSMWGGKKRKKLRKIYDKLFAKSVLGATDKVICHSENERMLLSEFSIPKENLRIIPAGVDFNRFEKIPSPHLFRENFQIQGKMVLYAGRLASNKGLVHLVDAIPMILSEFPDTTFVLVGEDEGQKNLLKSRAAALGVSERLKFTGHIKDEDLFLSAFSACDVFVLPSEYEAFGLVLLEAAACEKPCVATNVGGVSEVLENGKTGMLVEYGNPDALANATNIILGDEQKRKNMGRAGRTRVKENFTWPKIVDKIEQLYKEVV